MSKPECSYTIYEILLDYLFILFLIYKLVGRNSIKNNFKLLRDIGESVSLETFKIVC